ATDENEARALTRGDAEGAGKCDEDRLSVSRKNPRKPFFDLEFSPADDILLLLVVVESSVDVHEAIIRMG
ncbi:hypothetical protein FRC11_013225, partial [Ceratobasidium sp. 423]